MNTRALKLGLCACGFAALGGATASAIVIPDSGNDAAYLSNAANFPAAGTFFTSSTGFGGGVLIAPQYIITAAHKITAGDTYSFTVGGASYTVDKAVADPQFNASNLDGGHDLAVCHLASPVVGVTPSPLYTTTDEKGKTIAVVGPGAFGRGSTGWSDSGYAMRAGTNVVDLFGGDPQISTASSILMAYDFDDPANASKSVTGSSTATSLECMIANADSGGGSFINIGGVNYVAGIHSGVSDSSSKYGTVGFDTRISQEMAFINSVVTPEPSGLAMLGLGGLLLARRRRPVAESRPRLI